MSTVLQVRAPLRVESSLSLRRRSRRTDLLVLLGLLLVTGLVLGVNVARFPVLQDDEGTYAAQAWAVQHGRLAHYTYWFDHPPLGWIQIAALSWLPQALHLGGAELVASTRAVMVVFALLDVPLLLGIARRLGLTRPFAAAAVLLWILSPLTVFQARQVYLDNVALTWVLLAAYLVLSPRRMLWHYAAGACAMAVALLSKETTALLLPMVALLFWRNLAPALRTFAVAITTTCFTGMVLAYPVFAALRRELLPGDDHVSLVDALAFQFATRESSGSLGDPGSDKRQTLEVWLSHDHRLLLGGLIAALVVLVAVAVGVLPHRHPGALTALARHRSADPSGSADGRTARLGPLAPVAVGLLLGLVPVLKPGYLPVMFVIAYLPLAALLVAGVAGAVWAAARRPAGGTRTVTTATALVAALAILSVVVPSWVRGDHRALTEDQTLQHRQVVAWLREEVPRDRSVLADDSYWLDLVDAGFSGDGWSGPIWHYKVDLDPDEAAEHLPGGWKDVDYVVYNDAIKMHLEVAESPLMEAAVEHGRVVASFGDPALQILEVVPTGPGTSK